MNGYLTEKAVKKRWWDIPVGGFSLLLSAIGIEVCLEEMAEVYERVELVMSSPSKFHPRRNRLLFTVVVRFFLRLDVLIYSGDHDRTKLLLYSSGFLRGICSVRRLFSIRRCFH